MLLNDRLHSAIIFSLIFVNMSAPEVPTQRRLAVVFTFSPTGFFFLVLVSTCMSDPMFSSDDLVM